MSEAVKLVIYQALAITSSERAIVAEQLLLSLDRPDPKIDVVWGAEVEARLDAYEKGELEPIPASDVLGKYET